ncbi:MAG: hypothetical protein GQ574_15765 [Crocinitomix sp.]|nr:hypothetical protein [Crocinitomix sp.]
MLNIKNIIFAIAALLLVNVSFAQKGTQSPYSSFGLGERNYEGYAVFSSMGGVSLANTDSTIVNTSNPASYAYIARNLPVLQIGLNGKLSTFSTETESTNQRHFGLNQFQLGLPIKKNWGAGIGIKPYSFTGYTVTNYSVDSDNDTIMQAVNEGSGGIRIANFGLSYRPLNYRTTAQIMKKMVLRDTATNEKYDTLRPIKGFRTHNLSIGVNANYLFGTSKQIRSTEFIPSSTTVFNSRVTDGLRVSGLSTEFGINYNYGFKANNLSRVLSVAATFSPASEVRAYQDLYAFSYIGSFYRGQTVQVRDTIQLIQDDEGLILKPEAFGIGLQYQFSPYNSSSSLRLGFDFKMEKWSTFYTQFSDVQNSGELKDRMSIGIGFERAPTLSALIDPDNFLSGLTYRLGVNYAQTELLVKNNLGEEIALDNYGMSFGLSIPIRPGVSNTNINLGGSLGNLGTAANGIIQERYMGLYVGLSITPERSNRWFLKRKYN